MKSCVHLKSEKNVPKIFSQKILILHLILLISFFNNNFLLSLELNFYLPSIFIFLWKAQIEKGTYLEKVARSIFRRYRWSEIFSNWNRIVIKISSQRRVIKCFQSSLIPSLLREFITCKTRSLSTNANG